MPSSNSCGADSKGVARFRYSTQTLPDLHRLAQRLSAAYEELGLCFQGLLCPRRGEGAVDVLWGVEVQAKACKVRAKSQRCQVRILHPDDPQQAHEAVWI